MTWKVLLAYMEHEMSENEDASLYSPDSLQVSEGRSFWMSLQLEEGKTHNNYHAIPQTRPQHYTEVHHPPTWDKNF